MSEQKKWETKDNNGSVFVNRRKQKETHPDYTGEIKIDGKLYWLNAWQKETRNGEAWFSFAVSPKEDRGSDQSAMQPKAPPKPPVASEAPPQTIDDDVPF